MSLRHALAWVRALVQTSVHRRKVLRTPRGTQAGRPATTGAGAGSLLDLGEGSALLVDGLRLHHVAAQVLASSEPPCVVEHLPVVITGEPVGTGEPGGGSFDGRPAGEPADAPPYQALAAGR
jgi:hypothetical protein